MGRQPPAGRREIRSGCREARPDARKRRKIEAAGLATLVGYTQGDARKLELAATEFDVAFLVAVLGEIPERQECLRALHRVIRPGGLLSITEHLPEPDFSRFTPLCPLVEQEGFEFTERFGPPWSYTANFRRPPPHGKNAA